MKTSPASILSVISLSLALCACDSGDKKETDSTAPKLPPKKPKESVAPADAGDKAPPVSDATAPAMPAGEPGLVVPDDSLMGDLEKLNGAIKMYNTKRSIEMMSKMGPNPGKGGAGGQNAEKQKYLANANKAKSATTTAGLTSLDDLVKAGLLKSIPQAPAGKKYVFDVKTQEARLADK